LRTNVSLLTFGTVESLKNPKKVSNELGSRKDYILEKAVHMYRERGYNSSSVRDLAQQVGIEAPSIYSHFKSKEHILRQICFEMANTFITGLKKAEKEKYIRERLRVAIKEHMEAVINQKEASVVMWNEWKFMTNPYHKEFQAMIRDYERRFENIIKEGIKQGNFRNHDSEVVSNLILSSLNSLAHWHKNESKSLIELEQEFSEIYLEGIVN